MKIDVGVASIERTEREELGLSLARLHDTRVSRSSRDSGVA